MSNQKAIIKSVLTGIAANDKLSKQIDRSSIADFALNTESLDSTMKVQAESSYNALKSDIEGVLDQLNLESYGESGGFTQTQKDAAMAAASMVIKPGLYGRKLKESFSNITSGSDVVVNNLEGISSAPDIDQSEMLQHMNLESFDGQNLQSVYYTTIALAVATSKQDDFAEGFFPLIVLGPADAFYEVKINIDNFIKDYRHITPDGIKFQENKTPILKSLFNNKLLGENRLALKPFIDNDTNKDLLVQDSKFGVSVNDETFDSAPYAFNKSIDIFAITNTKGEASKGSIPDFTDALDRSIALQNIYLQHEEGSDKFTKLDLNYMPRTYFNIPPEGHNKELVVNFKGQFGLNTKTSIDFRDDVKAPANFLFGALNAGDEYAITVEFSVNGSVRTDTSIIKLTSSNIDTINITKVSDGTTVTDLTQGVGKDIADAVAKFVIAGYDLDVSVTNSNFRKRAILLQSESLRFRYPCRFRSGVNVLKPVYDLMGEDNDAMSETIEKQALAISAMVSVGAVNTLVNFVNKLNDLKEVGVLETATSLTKTPALTAVYPWYNREELPMKDIVDSLNSTDKRENISAAIINKISDTVTVMGVESNYYNVYEKLYPSKKKTVVIGTDPYIASYLGKQLQPAVNASVSSNTFSLTHDVDAVIVSTCNPLMSGKIVVSFSVLDNPNRNTAPDILSFGYGLYTPPFNREVQVTKGNSTFKELHVEPRFEHIPNLPIAAEFRVEGITEAIKKNVVHNKVVV